MVEEKAVSTRGLKADACLFGELIFDVNSAYFHNHGGYEYARQFYADAYRATVDIVGGEQYILSAVMHADERNRAMSEALGQDVYHYHLHVVYIPVVEKQILWSKRCKDKSLVGTVKETIMQVSSSKKWLSKPALDEAREIKELAKKGVTADRRISDLEEKVARAQKDAGIWKRRYEKLLDQVQDYLAAVKKAPERVADFLRKIIRERDIPQSRQPTRTHQHSVER